MFCIAPIPHSTFAGCLRLFFIALESTFTYFFHANNHTRKDQPDMNQLSPWEDVP
jgi:hypothetical protein